MNDNSSQPTSVEWETALALIERQRQILGSKFVLLFYEPYIQRVADILRKEFPVELQTIADDNLRNLISFIHLSCNPSRGLMKRLETACDGCGWCCSQTSKIVVTKTDAEQISAKLHQKTGELFSCNGHEWTIKRGQPCQWWNPRNGRCMIYKIRPQTCRAWPQWTNEKGQHGLQARPDCRYSVMVMVFQTIEAIRDAAHLSVLTAGNG